MSTADPLFTNPALVADVASAHGFNVAQICGAWQLKSAEFAELTARRTESVAGSVKKDAFVRLSHPGTVRVVRELVELLGLLRSMQIDPGAWLRTPLPSYEGRTPFELVHEGKGRELVERLLGLAVGDVGG